jgi:hypothetical protein
MPSLLARGLTCCVVFAVPAASGCPLDEHSDPPADAGAHDAEDAEAEDEDAQVDAGDAAAADAQAPKDAAVHDAGPCKAKAPTSCPDPPTRYADVEPIIAQRCLSCHDGLHEQWPLTNYEHVSDWYDQIRAQMLSCSMPPSDSGIDMPVEERETLLRWIRCGYPE